MLDELKSLGLSTDPNGKVVSVSDPELAWIMLLAKENIIQKSLETGLGNGHSAAALFLAEAKEHTAVELSTSNLRISQSNVAKAKKNGQYFRLLMGASDVRLASLVAQGEKFDLILIDGSHSYEDVFIDVHYARSLLDSGGIMVLDDANWKGVSTAVTHHTRALHSSTRKSAHAWSAIEPPPRIKDGVGFNMVAFRRTDNYG